MGQEYKSFLYLEKNHPEQRTAELGLGWQEKELATLVSREEKVL